ncbi:MAG: hypothetical protein IKW10_05100 [Oscillospiraceae bacterium]|nr:hypothetical protein [Oscillospiraceae bacterium]
MITQQIKRLFCNLTSAERKIATYVIDSPQEVTGLTVHQLAEKCAGTGSGHPGRSENKCASPLGIYPEIGLNRNKNISAYIS